MRARLARLSQMVLDDIQSRSFLTEILQNTHFRSRCFWILYVKKITLMTTTEQPHTLRGLPSLSILHKPDHSPSFLFESTRINGIWCSLHRAVMSFLYWGSSQLSAKMHSTAWRLSKALHAWWIPCTIPSAIKDFFSTSCKAVFTSIGPPPKAGAGAGTSLIMMTREKTLVLPRQKIKI